MSLWLPRRGAALWLAAICGWLGALAMAGAQLANLTVISVDPALGYGAFEGFFTFSADKYRAVTVAWPASVYSPAFSMFLFYVQLPTDQAISQTGSGPKLTVTIANSSSFQSYAVGGIAYYSYQIFVRDADLVRDPITGVEGQTFSVGMAPVDRPLATLASPSIVPSATLSVPSLWTTYSSSDGAGPTQGAYFVGTAASNLVYPPFEFTGQTISVTYASPLTALLVLESAAFYAQWYVITGLILLACALTGAVVLCLRKSHRPKRKRWMFGRSKVAPGLYSTHESPAHFMSELPLGDKLRIELHRFVVDSDFAGDDDYVDQLDSAHRRIPMIEECYWQPVNLNRGSQVLATKSLLVLLEDAVSPDGTVWKKCALKKHTVFGVVVNNPFDVAIHVHIRWNRLRAGQWPIPPQSKVVIHGPMWATDASDVSSSEVDPMNRFMFDGLQPVNVHVAVMSPERALIEEDPSGFFETLQSSEDPDSDDITLLRRRSKALAERRSKESSIIRTGLMSLISGRGRSRAHQEMTVPVWLESSFENMTLGFAPITDSDTALKCCVHFKVTINPEKEEIVMDPHLEDSVLSLLTSTERREFYLGVAQIENGKVLPMPCNIEEAGGRLFAIMRSLPAGFAAVERMFTVFCYCPSLLATSCGNIRLSVSVAPHDAAENISIDDVQSLALTRVRTLPADAEWLEVRIRISCDFFTLPAVRFGRKALTGLDEGAESVTFAFYLTTRAVFDAYTREEREVVPSAGSSVALSPFVPDYY